MSRTSITRFGSAGIAALFTVLSVVPLAAGENGNGKLLLGNKSYWRYHVTHGTELCRRESGELVPIHPKATSERYHETVDGRRKYKYRMRVHPRHRAWPLPANTWTAVDFDDSSWQRRSGPFAAGAYGSRKSGYGSTPLLCLRGKFQVDDPGKVGDLKLSITYLGGLIVYVNGKEIARGHLPKGKVEPTTPAEDYPIEVFFDKKSLMLDVTDKAPETQSAMKSRLRKAADVAVPAAMLRDGTNVLAIELHRPPAPEKFFTCSKSKKYVNQQHLKKYCWWSRVGATEISLEARSEAAATPNVGQVEKPKGFHVWNQPLVSRVYTTHCPDPCEPLRAVRICGARNGAHSGQVVVGSDQTIKGLKVQVTDLTGPGKISASAVQFRYPHADGKRYRSRSIYFDSLEEFAPEQVPLRSGWAVQPVWMTVRIPSDAKAGTYKGKATIQAEGQEAVSVPLEVEVADWRMPDSKEFFTFLGIIQSPESVALQYKVPMWSEKHWKLLDRTFKLLGELGNKVVYVTAQYKTHFGNEHSMIRYTKNGGGKYTPDFSIAQKYVGLALKHQGKMPVVGLYVWRAPWEKGHYAGAGPRGDHKILITVKDASTGKLEGAEGPAWGTPECAPFWQPVMDGMKKICAERGVADSLMIGMAGDYTPSDTALADLGKAGSGLKWIFHSHVVRNALGNQGSNPTGSRKWAGKKDGTYYPCGYVAAAWGGHALPTDPDFSRAYGWKNPMIRVETRTPPRGRLHLEHNVTARTKHMRKGDPKDAAMHGLGRLGADFWNVMGDKKKTHIAGRYIETAWGQLSIRCCGLALLAAGRDGAIATYRSEMVRENVQEIEARVFIEKALHDEAKKAKIGEELAKRALDILDERVRASQRRTQCSEITTLSRDLYLVTAEVAKKLEGK